MWRRINKKKNKEFYKDKIFEAACKYRKIAVNKETGEPDSCTAITCKQCALYHRYCGDGCTQCWSRWLEEEHIETVLDGVEKRYLESVIRPFRNRVEHIQKSNIGGEEYTFIRIFVKCYKPEEGNEAIFLPFFDGAKMYTGMEKEKFYTIEELGLFDNGDNA